MKTVKPVYYLIMMLLLLTACDGMIMDPHIGEYEISGTWEIEETVTEQGLESEYLHALIQLEESDGNLHGTAEFEYKNLSSPHQIEIQASEQLSGAYRLSESADLILYSANLNFFFSGDALVPGLVYKGKVTLIDGMATVVEFEGAILRKK